MQELVANAKNLIVVKSVMVPVANMVANMGQLLNRGVPLRHVLKGIVAKTAETNDYIKRRSKEIALEAELRAAKARQDIVKMRKLDNEIRSIQDSYKRMSIWPVIEAGEFSAISNGKVNADFAHFATAMYGEFSAISNGKVNTHDLAIADGQWTDWVEGELQKLPRGFQTAARYGLITRDTALFQGLAQSIQYGDFVAGLCCTTT